MNAALRRIPAGGLRGRIDCVHNPHHDAAYQQRSTHDVKAFQVLPNNFCQQERGDCGVYKRNKRQTQGMRPYIAISALASRKIR